MAEMILPLSGRQLPGKPSIIIVGKAHKGLPDLAQIIRTLHAFGLGLGSGYYGQKQARYGSHNTNTHQQFYQGKSSFIGDILFI